MKRRSMPADARTWRDRAAREVTRVLDELPPELRARIDDVPVVLEGMPDAELAARGWGRVLGLFTGVAYPDAVSVSQQRPPEIVLFLDALRSQSGGDPQRFREEVRRTLLHEIGHYLGLDEEDLAERGLA